MNVKSLLLLVLLLVLVAVPAFASNIVDTAKVGVVGGDVVAFTFGSNQTITAKNSVTFNTTQITMATDWFTVNASILAPTVIVNWAYNYTYATTKWINTSCSFVGCGATYTADWLLNTTVIPGNVKIYQVAGTYINASPHWYSLNSTLRYTTNGNPSKVNVYAGTQGAPLSVHVAGTLETPGVGYVYSPVTDIVSVLAPGTDFTITWAAPSNAPQPGQGVPLLLVLVVVGFMFFLLAWSQKVKKHIYSLMGGLMGTFLTGWVYTYGVFYDDSYTGGIWVDHIIDPNLVMVLVMIVTIASFLSIFLERYE